MKILDRLKPANEKAADPTEAIVTAMYRGILNREPDAGGLASAVRNIKGGAPYENVIRGMLSSEEYQSKNTPAAIEENQFAEKLVTAVYRGILSREPDSVGFEGMVKEVKGGVSYEEIVRRMLASEEYQKNQSRLVVPPHTLPDLTQLMPEYYDKFKAGESIFKADKDSDFDLLEDLIVKHRYYDSFGVWAPKIDLDKRIIAAIVRGLGGKSVFELGCFSGTVLSLLEEAGLEVTGMDVSHLAFIMAYPNVRSRMVFGDLLDWENSEKFDTLLAMDIIEHLNPLKLGKYIARLASMLDQNGYMYLNSPMFGPDRIFGDPFPTYLPEWESVGDASFWRRLHCDKEGWPMHGHLVWGGPGWWEEQFRQHGLVRDTEIETTIHKILGDWFKNAHGRKSLFVLKHAENSQSPAEVAARVATTLRAVEGLE